MLSDLVTPRRDTKSRMAYAGYHDGANLKSSAGARVVPTIHMLIRYQLCQATLRQNRVGQVQTREFILAGAGRGRQVLHKPVVQRAMIFEFERAEGMRGSLNRVRLAMREVIRWVDTPLVACAWMDLWTIRRSRIAQVDVTRCHIDFLARSTFSPSPNSPAFMRENRSRFSSTARSRYGLGLPGSVMRATILTYLIGRQIIDIGLSRLQSDVRPTFSYRVSK